MEPRRRAARLVASMVAVFVAWLLLQTDDKGGVDQGEREFLGLSAQWWLGILAGVVILLIEWLSGGIGKAIASILQLRRRAQMRKVRRHASEVRRRRELISKWRALVHVTHKDLEHYAMSGVDA